MVSSLEIIFTAGTVKEGNEYWVSSCVSIYSSSKHLHACIATNAHASESDTNITRKQARD